MRIGEYLVKGKYITEDALLEALILQKYNNTYFWVRSLSE